MRTLVLMTFLAGATIAGAQQLQNPNFEEWTVTGMTWDNQPIYDAAGWNGAVQTTDSYTGTYAATVIPYMSCGIASGWMIYGGIGTNFNPWDPGTFVGSGTPVNFKPSSVTGYFKFLSPDDSMDVAQGIVILKKFNAVTQQSEEIGRGELTFTPTTDYTAFTIDIADLQPGIQPDSMVVAFSSGMGYSWDWENDSLYFGTLYVDQLRLQSEGTMGMTEQVALTCSFFPNPSSGTLHFSFVTAADDDFSLLLTDAAGKQVLVQRAAPGIQHTLDLSRLAAGNYHAFITGRKGIYATENICVGR